MLQNGEFDLGLHTQTVNSVTLNGGAIYNGTLVSANGIVSKGAWTFAYVTSGKGAPFSGGSWWHVWHLATNTAVTSAGMLPASGLVPHPAYPSGPASTGEASCLPAKPYPTQ